MNRVFVSFSLAVFFGMLAAPAFAQQGTADIGGRVTDEQGGVLPGVMIVLTNEDTGVFRDVTSGEDGSYFVSALTPGRYRLAAKLASFKNFERRGLLLEVGKTLTINFILAVGTLAESVTVTDVSPLIDVTSTEVGGNIGTTDLTELPARAVRVLHQRVSHGAGLLRQVEQSGQTQELAQTMGRHVRRTDRAKQIPLLWQPGTDHREPEPGLQLSRTPGVELLDG